MEKIILRQLTHHLDTRNLLPEEQYGFRKEHRTIDQLLFFTQKVKDAQNRKTTNHSIAAFLDLTQTFDKRLAPGFHHRVKAKTSFQDDDVPIDDDTTTKPLFTPQENGRKVTRDKVPRLRWNPWQKHVKSTSVSTIIASCGSQLP
ncbi:hypothetical protein LAZ67_15001638 [Cordylochernes scorpioides]|uniref:Reverse transcriptase domain-containing protein n=1 Tax=Cordylochernes scorpioides TaxID=51811 RepID=A0ABY6L9Q1_9ARAC|nr:hypothetical protein LAZ67_15001638 [Cordylochernes scorpioides]